VQDHLSSCHGKKPGTYKGRPLWQKCQLQTFFAENQHVRYFVLRNEDEHGEGGKSAPASHRAAFFRFQEHGILQARQDAVEHANKVNGFEDHASTVVPWLSTTGIVDHIKGLRKDQIRAAIALPSYDEQSVLQTIISETENMLREAHGWCFDGVDCMLTWPGRVVLSRFQSSQVELMGKTRAFAPKKDAATLKTYFNTAKCFLAYLERVGTSRRCHFTVEDDATQTPEQIIELTDEQLKTWQSVRRLARQELACSDETVAVRLRDELVRMWMLLISHSTGARRYRSPLVSFYAMLSIKPSTSGWMRPGDFNSHLSAIIWVVQLLIFYDSARKERQGEGQTLQLVKRCCEDYLQQTVETPMGEILRWRLLLFQVSQDTVGDHEAEWNEDEDVLTFEDTELRMDQVPTLLVSEYSDCRRLLYDDLMFGTGDLRRMHSWALKDNGSVDVIDWNFTQHRDNDKILQGAQEALLVSIEQSAQLCRLFLDQDKRSLGGYVWRKSAIISYEATVQEFLARLCVLIHISGGQPIREKEFFAMTWRNTQRRRSITIRHEKVMIHVQYHKGQEQTGKYKDNVRFLAHPIGDLLLDYIVFVLPLRQVFLRQSSPGMLLPPFLWECGGTVWPESHLTRCLEAASTRAQIPRLHISNWRQMTVAIVKTKFASHIGYFEEDKEDEDAEEMEVDIRAMTKQRNHKTQTVNRAYANQTGATFGNVWDGLVRTALRASTLWQDFWGVDTILKAGKRGQREEGSRLTKRIAMGVYKPRKPWSAEALLGGMRKLFNDDKMVWRTAEQEHALVTLMFWTEQVIAILPTGAGKSMLFMLPCTLPDAGITILIVPLVSLRADLLRRIEELKIDHLEWLPGESREAALVFVSVEAACTKGFTEYARALVNQQKLDRIVVDECHLTVTAVEYRPKVVDLTNIRSLRTQFVYLTATLPPSMQREFEERNHLFRPTTIRASANRSNIFYMVRKVDSRKGSLLEQAAAEVKDAWIESDLFDHSRDKIILYVRTREEANDLSSLLQCDSYTAESGTAVEKKHILSTWVGSTDRPFIVATTALAEGFDYPHVRLVVNVNEPESLVIFAQESGRAGRDGLKAYSLVLLAPTWKAQDKGSSTCPILASSRYDVGLRKERDRHAVHQYLRGKQCYRTSLTEYLDSAQHRRWCMPEDVPCDVCRSAHNNALAPREVVKQGEEHIGLDLIQQDRLRAYSELARYREDLAAVQGPCLLCRGREEAWDHSFSQCQGRHGVIQERNKAQQRHKAKGRQWLRPFTGCFWCLNPQSVCQRAESGGKGDQGGCEHSDVVLPLCYGLFYSIGGPLWLRKHFEREFVGIDSYFDWLGEESMFGGGKAVQAVRVAAKALAEYRG
jgi:superfamily II DNA helicase RecQ